MFCARYWCRMKKKVQVLRGSHSIGELQFMEYFPTLTHWCRILFWKIKRNFFYLFLWILILSKIVSSYIHVRSPHLVPYLKNLLVLVLFHGIVLSIFTNMINSNWNRGIKPLLRETMGKKIMGKATKIQFLLICAEVRNWHTRQIHRELMIFFLLAEYIITSFWNCSHWPRASLVTEFPNDQQGLSFSAHSGLLLSTSTLEIKGGMLSEHYCWFYHFVLLCFTSMYFSLFPSGKTICHLKMKYSYWTTNKSLFLSSFLRKFYESSCIYSIN